MQVEEISLGPSQVKPVVSTLIPLLEMQLKLDPLLNLLNSQVQRILKVAQNLNLKLLIKSQTYYFRMNNIHANENIIN